MMPQPGKVVGFKKKDFKRKKYSSNPLYNLLYQLSHNKCDTGFTLFIEISVDYFAIKQLCWTGLKMTEIR